MDLQGTFGNLDIYLFDQLLKGRIAPGHRILDAGAGGGRNLVYLLRAGFDVWGVDRDPAAVDGLRHLAAALAPSAPADRFRVADTTALPHAEASFDVVIANALLHFAPDRATFDGMVSEMWRVLAPGGMLFARLASSIGLEHRVAPILDRPGWFRLPDESERFLVDEATLRDTTARLGGVYLEPIKTTNVENLRCMTTWCIGKARAEERVVSCSVRSGPEAG